MNLRISAYVVAVLFSLPVLGEAASGVNKFHLSTDLSRFRGDSTRVYTEIYYSFDVSKLPFARKGDEWDCVVLMDIYFKRSANDSIVARDRWKLPFTTDDTTLLSTSRLFVDYQAFLVKPDIYRLYIVGTCVNDSTQRDSLSVALDLRPVEKNQIVLSDVELCTSITQVEKDSVGHFIKNTYDVRPNASRIFGITQPVIFYYLEAYNLLKNSSQFYYTHLSITNSVGTDVYTRDRALSRINESNVEVGTVKVNTLRTGSYTFNFTIVDSVDRSSHTSSKKFFVYNPTLPTDSLTAHAQGSVLATEYATMTDAELDQQIAEIRYIASRAEQARFKGVTGADAKRQLLFEFWNRRDEDPATPESMTKKEYLRRVDYANEHFKNAYREGWKTDRGRVFLVYGPPDEVERHADEADTKPYEIWTYNSIQGGVIFVFGDRSGFSDYVLLHSTHRDELHDENWINQLRTQ
ncbi:MAG TPA: GWxTD domain-containing protein [Bacteroidota bacterium]|nr:GWxTD domain-containing protein [Bacteroidota bacterium]